MISSSWLVTFGNILVVISAVEATLFCVLYHLSSPWWLRPIGRIVMGLVGSLAAVLDLSVLRLLTGSTLDTPWWLGLRTVVFTGVPAALGWLIVILIRSQILVRRVPPEGGENEDPRT